MARSLTVNHVENPSTNRLFNVFILIAVAVLLAGGLATYATDAGAAPSAPVVEE